MATQAKRPSTADKPRPLPTEPTQPFWDGLAAGEVRIPRCDVCGAWTWYPRLRCSRCLSDRLTWTTVAGTAVLYTFTVTRQPIHPAFADETPQVQAIVTLDGCGVRMTSTLVEAEPGAVEVGQPLAPVFEPGGDGITLLRFRPLPKPPAPAPA